MKFARLLGQIVSTQNHPAWVVVIDSVAMTTAGVVGAITTTAVRNAVAPAGLHLTLDVMFRCEVAAMVGIMAGAIGAWCSDTVQRRRHYVRSARRTLCTTGIWLAVCPLLWTVAMIFTSSALRFVDLFDALAMFGPLLAPLGYRLGGFVSAHSTEQPVSAFGWHGTPA